MNDEFEIGKIGNGDPVVVVVNEEAAYMYEQTASASSGLSGWTWRELMDADIRGSRKEIVPEDK